MFKYKSEKEQVVLDLRLKEIRFDYYILRTITFIRLTEDDVCGYTFLNKYSKKIFKKTLFDEVNRTLGLNLDKNNFKIDGE